MHVLRMLWLIAGAAIGLLALGLPVGADVPAEATELVEAPAMASVEGAAWVGVDMPGGSVVITIHFEKGSTLAYSYNGASYRNGTWRQDGDHIYFEMNNKYRETRAILRGDRIVGDSWNVVGNKWKTDIRLTKSP